MTHQEYRPGGKVMAAAVTTVAATYFYFLIFAQFGFLKSLQAAMGDAPGVIRPILAAMGLAGIAGSILAARIYSADRGRWQLAAGFGLCAIAAAGSRLADASPGFFAVAVLVGLGAGMTTVTLASALRQVVGGTRLGAVVGLGTGAAYGLCNLPLVFEAAADSQTLLALVAAGIGLSAAGWLTWEGPRDKTSDHDYTAAGVAIWTMVFLTLVCLDSAAFYIIQHTPVLKADAWSGAGRLGVNAGVHLVTAVLAGFALDRRWIGGTILFGAGTLLAACLLLNGGAVGAGAFFYTTGVSVYSVALVFYPARSQRPWTVALVYCLAGWAGSALGIALAENRHELPGAFVLVAGAVILLGLLARHFLRWPVGGV